MTASTDIIEARQALEGQEGVRLQVRARLLPQISGLATIDKRADGLIDRTAGEFNQPPSNRTAVALSAYDMRIEVRQTIFDGFSSWNQVKRQSLIKKQSYLSFLGTVNRTGSMVRQAFDSVLLRQGSVVVEQRRIAGLQQLVEWAARKRQAGEIAEFEQLRAETEVQAAQAEHAEARRNLAQSEQVFRRLLQLPDSSAPLRLSGKLVLRHFDLDFESAVSRARASRPEIESAHLKVAADKLQQRVLLGDRAPKFEFFASYGTRSSYYDDSRRLDGWTFGAVGRLNLFDGGESAGRRRTQLAERRVSEARLAEIEHSVVSQLRELYEGLAQSREALNARRKGADLALRALTQARTLYEAGQANLEQVLQSELVWRRLENSMNEAVYNFNVMVSQIEYSIGSPPEHVRDVSAPWKP